MIYESFVFNIPKTFYCASVGAFGIIGKRNDKQTLSWHICRDNFHRLLTKKSEKDFVFFTYAPNEKGRIINFMAEVEKRVAITEGITTKETNHPNVLYI